MIGDDGAEQVPVGGGRIGRDREDLQASTLHGAFYRGRADDQASSLSSLRDEHGEGRRRERFRREMPSQLHDFDRQGQRRRQRGTDLPNVAGGFDDDRRVTLQFADDPDRQVHVHEGPA